MESFCFVSVSLTFNTRFDLMANATSNSKSIDSESWSRHHHLREVLFVFRNVPATFLQLIPCILANPIRILQNTQLHLRSTVQIIANACHNGVDDELFGICKKQIWLISRFEKVHDRQPTISKCRIPQIHIHAAMRMNRFQISIVLLDAVWFWLESF